MAKKSQHTHTQEDDLKPDELDLLHKTLQDELHAKELGDVIITTEESITVTLFEDAPADEEEEEESIDSLFVGKKGKKSTAGEDDVEDFDSYFFEE